MSDGPIAVWDFTLPKRALTVGDVHALLRSHCKDYTFQLERGDTTGYEHYQGRFSFYKKKRLNSAIACFPDTGIHLSPTCNNARTGPAFYCMKADTRIEGPWTEKDYQVPKRKLRCIDIMKEQGLRPWQSAICEKLEGWDARTIHVVIDPVGDNGKSWIFKWIINELDGGFIPATCKSAQEIVSFAMSFPDKRVYGVDMPRAMKKSKLEEFYAAIETIKNGILYDIRYKGRMYLMDEPNIVVFTNTPPKMRYLSRDRWKLWTIKNNELHIFKWSEWDFTKPRKYGVQAEEELFDQEGSEEATDDEEVLQSEVSSEDHEADSEEGD